MLQGMRKHANSYVMSLIFAIIILVFVFSFGPGSARYCGSPMPTAARVNGRVVTRADFEQEYARTFSQMQRWRQDYTVETARAENLKQTVLDRLVNRELLIQEAADRGLVIGDDELARTIVENPSFQTDGKFDRELYRRYATSLNLSEAAFEETMRNDLVAGRMREVLQDTVSVSSAEVRELWERRNNRVDLWLVKVDPIGLKKDAAVDESEVAAFVKGSRPRIDEYYNKHATTYNQPEKVQARHILVKVEENASSAEVDQARKRIDGARARVMKGEGFAAVAKEISEDGSAARGGDLGAHARGTWVPPFEEAAFTLAEGEVSEVVRTQFGFHVIKVEKKVAPVERKIDDVAEEIAGEILRDDAAREKARLIALEWQERLNGAANPEELNPEEEESPDPFAPKVVATGFFEQGQRYIPRIGMAPELNRLAFGLTSEKPFPDEPVEVSGRFYALKLKEREQADPVRFEEDSARLRQELMGRRQAQAVEQYLKLRREAAKLEFNPGLVSYASNTEDS